MSLDAINSISTASLPADVRAAGAQAKKDFKSALGFEQMLVGQLVKEMTRKRLLIERLRRDLRYHTMLQIWLYLHVPLSFALLGALIAHVVSVFYFW